MGVHVCLEESHIVAVQLVIAGPACTFAAAGTKLPRRRPLGPAPLHVSNRSNKCVLLPLPPRALRTPGQEEVDDSIMRDIHRTFPEHPYFGLEAGQRALFKVLKVRAGRSAGQGGAGVLRPAFVG